MIRKTERRQTGTQDGKTDEMNRSLGLPFLQPYINPYTAQHRHFSPDDRDDVFLRNVGIYRPVYMAPKPKRPSTIKASLPDGTGLKRTESKNVTFSDSEEDLSDFITGGN
jgi:hypothetical protein